MLALSFKAVSMLILVIKFIKETIIYYFFLNFNISAVVTETTLKLN